MNVIALLAVAAVSAPKVSFDHGVASGDVSSSSVVLWTRVTPRHDAYTGTRVHGRYVMCEADEDGRPPPFMFFPSRRCKTGRVCTGPHRDYTLKAEPSGLKSNTRYFYQFRVGGVLSEVGVTKTFPSPSQDTEEMRYAVLACANFGQGYFHAYELAADVKDIDFFVHVGDYIYEYGSYINPDRNRRQNFGPLQEAVTLSDYRSRYAFYKGDASLRKVHRRAPMLMIWDDHEIANDARSDWATNHQRECGTPSDIISDLDGRAVCDKDEGEYLPRVDAATRAYFEWLPVSEAHGAFNDPAARKRRKFEAHFGNLATIVGYDTRLTKRTASDPTALFYGNHALRRFVTENTNVTAWYEEPLASQLAAAAAEIRGDLDPTAELMGEEARESMRSTFDTSVAHGATWQILATPVPIAERNFPDFVKAGTMLPDALRADGASDAAASQLGGAFNAFVSAAFASATFRLSQASGMERVPWNTDTWDGYDVEREKVLGIFARHTRNGVVIAGDSHNAFAAEVRQGDKERGDPVAVSYDTTSVSSTGLERAFSAFLSTLRQPGADAFEYSFKQSNPWMKYANIKDRGFIYFTVTRDTYKGEYVMINKGRDASVSSNEGPLSSPAYDYSFYCDGVLTATAGRRGVFTDIASPQFFHPTPCATVDFNASYFEAIFEPRVHGE